MRKKIDVWSNENHIVIMGDCTREEAAKALRKTETEEWGLTEGDFFDPKVLYQVKMRRSTLYGEEGYDWSEKRICGECGSKLKYPIKGWVGNL